LESKKTSKQGEQFSVASIILGILSVATGSSGLSLIFGFDCDATEYFIFLGFCFALSVVWGIVGIVLSQIAHKKGCKKEKRYTGLLLSIFGLLSFLASAMTAMIIYLFFGLLSMRGSF